MLEIVSVCMLALYFLARLTVSKIVEDNRDIEVSEGPHKPLFDASNVSDLLVIGLPLEY